MDLINKLKAEIERGFYKSDLERLIGLPTNTLSGIMSGKRDIGIKGKLKIEKYFQQVPLPDPLAVNTENGKVNEKIDRLTNGPLIPEGSRHISVEELKSHSVYEPVMPELEINLDKLVVEKEPLVMTKLMPIEPAITVFGSSVIKRLAEDGATAEQVEEMIKGNKKLTPGEISMIRSKIKS